SLRRLSGEQSETLEERVEARLPTHETLVKVHRVFRITKLQDRTTECVADLGAEHTRVLEPCERVGVEHFGPLVRVVTRSIPHGIGEEVREAREHRVILRVRRGGVVL